MVSFDRDAFAEELLDLNGDVSAVFEDADELLHDLEYDDRDDGCAFSVIDEELEWISNKHAFPGLETFLEITQDEPEPHIMFYHGSPVSVLKDTSIASSNDSYSSRDVLSSGCVPVRSRSKGPRKRRHNGFGGIPNSQAWKGDVYGNPTIKVSRSDTGKVKAGWKCLHCGAVKTPQWRAGPGGPKTLCNACGVRYKSGRLVPEYRPAGSPTFSRVLHSNSHRKIMEMRKGKGS